MSQHPDETQLSLVMAAVAEVLGEQARPEHDFYSAGGDSVAAVWLADLLEERLDREVDLRLVLHAESFTAMAARLTAVTGVGAAPAAREEG